MLLLLLVLFPLCGCSNMEYDPTGKLNKEIALFHDGISLPVGNVGPVTVSDLMGNGSIRNLINEFMKEEADGRMYVEAAEDFFNKSAYEVALNSPDNTKPYHWEIGDVHGTVNSMSSALSMFGFCFPHQMLIVQMANPVYRDIPLNAKVRIACSAPDYSESYSKEEQLTDFSVPSSRTERTLVQFDLPEDVVDLLSKVDLLGLTLDLPENLPEKLREGWVLPVPVNAASTGTIAHGLSSVLSAYRSSLLRTILLTAFSPASFFFNPLKLRLMSCSCSEVLATLT